MTIDQIEIIAYVVTGLIIVIVVWLGIAHATREKKRSQEIAKRVAIKYPCPVCGNREFEVAEERAGFVTSIKLPGRKLQTSSLMMCKKCGVLLRFTEP